MLDWRVYRLGFLALVPAMIAALFSVDPVAEPLPPGIATTGFDGRGAAATARQIEALGEERTPGSEADARAAALVAERFGAIPAGSLSRTAVSEGGISSAPPSEIITVALPGETDETILVVAPRTGTSPAGRLAAATASGVMTQLAASFGDARHESELIFASVPDASVAAGLAREVAAEREVIASISIDDARGIRDEDILLHRALGDLVASSTLAETARAVIGGETVASPAPESPFAQVARLAVGLTFGSQTRLLGEGIDAVALSGTGELPPSERDGAPDRVVRAPLSALGEVALRVVLALDAAPELPDEPGSYVRFGDNVVPGWAFSLVALALAIPGLIAAIDALARAARRGRSAARALQSTLIRAAPFVTGAVLLYLLSGTGIVADPSFPFDPMEFELGIGEAIVLALLLAGAGAVALALRTGVVPSAYGGPTLAAAAGLLASLAVLGIWAANPFAALLAVPIAHVWVVAATAKRPNPILVGLAVALALLPLAAAATYVADQLDLGADSPWTLAMLITGGQLRAAQVLIACGLGGALIALVAASTKRAPR